MKRTFESPLVLQVAKVLLERDLLAGASALGAALSTGQETEEVNDFVNTTWD